MITLSLHVNYGTMPKTDHDPFQFITQKSS